MKLSNIGLTAALIGSIAASVIGYTMRMSKSDDNDNKSSSDKKSS